MGESERLRGGSLLCRNDAERGRLMDMSRRLGPAKRGAMIALLIANVIGVPTFGVWYLPPLVLAVVAFAIGQARLVYVRRPEYVLAASWLFGEAMIAISIALAHGPRLYLLALFISPLLLWSVAFPPRPAAMAVVISAVAMTLTAVLVDPRALADAPFVLLYPLTVVIAASIPAAAAREVDRQSRQTAVADQLTGLLNRVALQARVAEIEHQTTISGHPVTIVVGDIDHFKHINDTYGHAQGDEVLKEVASRLSGAAEPEPVYRLGGEEFIVLLPDVDVGSARTVAERLQAYVRDGEVAGVGVTMSFGVAVSSADEPLDYELLFGRADRALYRAKAEGRDRVVYGTADDPRLASENVVTSDRRRAKDARDAASPTSPAELDPRIARERAQTASWLVSDDLEREHLVDLGRRIHQSNRPAYIVTFGAVVAAAFVYGWPTVVAPILAAIIYNVVEHHLDRLPRPEYALGAMWLATQAANGIGLGFVRLSSAHAPLFALPVMVIMTIGSSAVFPRKGVVIGVTFAALVTIASGIVIDPSLAAADPGLIALPVALVITAGLIGAAAGRSAVDHRGAAVVDQLTGMLNRAALEARVAELTHHSTSVGQEVAVIVGDLDRFKRINDTHGHSTGDEVLQTVAYRIRKHLRTFESAYRVGGEEFVVLLPGVGVEEAEAVAQRICQAVRDEPVGRLPVTISLGLASSTPHEAFDYQAVFGEADQALYEAKRRGRDRVCGADTLASAIAA